MPSAAQMSAVDLRLTGGCPCGGVRVAIHGYDGPRPGATWLPPNAA